MAANRAVVHQGPRKVEVQSRDYPKMADPRGRKLEHAAILEVVALVSVPFNVACGRRLETEGRAS